jgi:hypothetical protein
LAASLSKQDRAGAVHQDLLRSFIFHSNIIDAKLHGRTPLLSSDKSIRYV